MQLEDDFLEFLHDTEVVMQVHVAIGSDCQTIAASPVKFCEILSYPTNKVINSVTFLGRTKETYLEEICPCSFTGRSFFLACVAVQRRGAPSAALTTGSSCTPTTRSGFSGGWSGGGHERRWPGRNSPNKLPPAPLDFELKILFSGHQLQLV